MFVLVGTIGKWEGVLLLPRDGEREFCLASFLFLEVINFTRRLATLRSPVSKGVLYKWDKDILNDSYVENQDLQ